jgi:hypothetical protein
MMPVKVRNCTEQGSNDTITNEPLTGEGLKALLKGHADTIAWSSTSSARFDFRSSKTPYVQISMANKTE